MQLHIPKMFIVITPFLNLKNAYFLYTFRITILINTYRLTPTPDNRNRGFLEPCVSSASLRQRPDLNRETLRNRISSPTEYQVVPRWQIRCRLAGTNKLSVCSEGLNVAFQKTQRNKVSCAQEMFYISLRATIPNLKDSTRLSETLRTNYLWVARFELATSSL